MSKKTQKTEIGPDFLIKIAKQVDSLKSQVELLSIQKQEASEDKSRFNYSVTFRVATLDGQGETQKSFLNELSVLLSKYNTTKFTCDFKQ